MSVNNVETVYTMGDKSRINQQNKNWPTVLLPRIPGMGEPGGLPSMGSHRVGDDWSDLAAAAAAAAGIVYGIYFIMMLVSPFVKLMTVKPLFFSSQ